MAAIIRSLFWGFRPGPSRSVEITTVLLLPKAAAKRRVTDAFGGVDALTAGGSV
jgi:hypothetical protein